MAGRILVADDSLTNRIVTKSRLTEAAYGIETASTAQEFKALAEKKPADVIIVSDDVFADGGQDLLEDLRHLPHVARIPKIMLTDEHGHDLRCTAVEAGFDAVMDRVPDPKLLRARIRNLMRRTAAERELRDAARPAEMLGFAEAAAPALTYPGQIAVIANSLSQGLQWRNGLTALLRERISVLDPANALQELGPEPTPDTIVLAVDHDDPGAALEIISDLRCLRQTLRSSIVVVQSEPDVETAVSALDLGVSDIVEHGFDAGEMALILRRELVRKSRDDTRRATLQDTARLASTDPLTGLLNRRTALRRLDEMMEKSQTQGEEFAIMVLDLDRFKSVNDRFGHRAGDIVLTEIAKHMQDCLRHGDFMARIGGEEFLAVIRSCNRDSARIAAERVRGTVENLRITVPNHPEPISLTVSIGLVIAGANGPSGTSSDLIELADRSLYAAKADGRNQITVFQSAA